MKLSLKYFLYWKDEVFSKGFQIDERTRLFGEGRSKMTKILGRCPYEKGYIDFGYNIIWMFMLITFQRYLSLTRTVKSVTNIIYTVYADSNMRSHSTRKYRIEIFLKVFAFLIICINGLGYTPTKQVNNQLRLGFIVVSNLRLTDTLNKLRHPLI